METFETKLEDLLKKESLTEEDKAFLKARKDYLTKDQVESLGLEDKKETVKKKAVKEEEEEEEEVAEQAK